MRFSARGEYGVRVMVDLARHYGEGPLSLTEIAAHEGLPRAYLEQIIAALRGAGLVEARRGRHGGYSLARPPAEIGMGEVVGLLEGGISPMLCIPADPLDDEVVLCVHQDGCATRVLWVKVRDSIVAALQSTTLADLVAGAPAGARRQPAPLTLIERTPLVECHDFKAQGQGVGT